MNSISGWRKLVLVLRPTPLLHSEHIFYRLVAILAANMYNSSIPQGIFDKSNCSDISPYAKFFLTEITLVEKICIGIGIVLVLVVIALFLYELRWLCKCNHYNEIIYKTIWLLGLYPVTSCTSMIAVIIPRSSLLNEFVASGYLAVALHKFVSLIILYYGGKAAMIEKKKGTTINLRSPPIACCCFCCPLVTPSRKNILRIEWMVLQCAVIRPPLVFISAVLWTEGLYDKVIATGNISTYISVINVISTLVGMYGLLLCFRSSKDDLKDYFLVPKFLCLQLVLIFMNLQTFVFSILGTNNIPACLSGIISSRVRSNAIHHLLMVLEMFMLAWIARHYYLKPLSQNYCGMDNPSQTCTSEQKNCQLSVSASEEPDNTKIDT